MKNSGQDKQIAKTRNYTITQAKNDLKTNKSKPLERVKKGKENI